MEVSSRSTLAPCFSADTLYILNCRRLSVTRRSVLQIWKINLESVASWADFSGLSSAHRQDAVMSGQTLLNQNGVLQGSGGCGESFNVWLLLPLIVHSVGILTAVRGDFYLFIYFFFTVHIRESRMKCFFFFCTIFIDSTKVFLTWLVGLLLFDHFILL